jgi:hypothetical protein
MNSVKDNITDKIPTNVKNVVTANIDKINQNTKVYRQKFIKFIKKNQIIVFILIVIIFLSLVSYRFAPKPRELIVEYNINKHIKNQGNIKSIYSYLGAGTLGKAGYIDPAFWNSELTPADKAKSKKLWFTLSDFHIASSAKTYLLLSKYYDYCSYDSIKYTLDANARFIELDIFRKGLNDDENIPVVTNGIEVGEWKMCINTLCLEKCLQKITKMAFNTNNSEANNNPLILYLNIHINAKLQFPKDNVITEKYGDFRFYNKIAKMLRDNINSTYLLDTQYSWYNQLKKNVSKIHLENIWKFKKKIIIMSNVSATCSNLSEYINIICPQNFKHNDHIDNISSFTNRELEGIYDVKSLRKKNKNRLTHVYEHSKKNGLSNYVSGTAIQEGCQLVSMYYQVNDINLQSYLKTPWGSIQKKPYSFNECSFILKNADLRNTHEETYQYTLVGGKKPSHEDPQHS